MEERIGKLATAVEHLGDVDLLLLGDSIFENWPTDLLSDAIGERSVINFSVGGATIQQLEWAIANTSVASITPKNVAILIGTNNIGMGPPSVVPDCAIAEGTANILEMVERMWPSAIILYVPILPRGPSFSYRENARAAARQKVTSIARSQLNVRIVDLEPGISCGIAARAGSVVDLDELDRPCPNYRPDRLHLTRDGYKVLGAELARYLRPPSYTLGRS